MLLKDILLIVLLSCIIATMVVLLCISFFSFKHKVVDVKEQEMIKQQAIQDYIKEMNKEND